MPRFKSSKRQTAKPARPEPDPGVIFETLNAHQQSAALRGAIDLDLFTAIGEGLDAVEPLAARCQASKRGIRILSDYLVVMGFLEKKEGRYRLPPTSAAFLDKRSPTYVGTLSRFLELYSG